MYATCGGDIRSEVHGLASKGALFFQESADQVVRLNPPTTGLGLEMLPPGERGAFLSSTGKLILAGPARLRHAAAMASLNRASLRQGWLLLPSHIDDR
jgi:hypothetical protein